MTNASNLQLYATRPHDCSYLPGQQATTVFIDPDAEIDSHIYSGLSEYGFRRSGNHIYRPQCADCAACISVRVPVAFFEPTRAQKRCLKNNSDLDIRFTQAPDLEEHYALYENYINGRHEDGDMYPPSRKQYVDFLNNPLGCTHYIEFRKDAKLIACAVSDQLDNGLSAIYTYYDPTESKRSLGRLAVLHQIAVAKAEGLDFVYLGYWIKQCQKMQYKTEYRPIQFLINKNWITAK